jgi:cob(I)alamin adenosyltransferase
MVPFSTKGDDGSTSLLSGERVRKSDDREEAIGSLDEANSAMGLAKSLSFHPLTRDTIEWLQGMMFVLGAEAASNPERAKELRERISASSVEEVSRKLQETESLVAMPRGFSVPGANTASAAVDVARAALRRAERRLVGLSDRGDMANPHILAFANRAADLLFVLARLEADRGQERSI